jgi:hypothetical protein
MEPEPEGAGTKCEEVEEKIEGDEENFLRKMNKNIKEEPKEEPEEEKGESGMNEIDPEFEVEDEDL